jgi:putative spermidine/putrescine transport system ATP-binding protein
MNPTSTTPGKREGASVEVRGLSRSYDAVVALRAVDLAVAPGEFVSLLGPSGCGKTTLLRCIAGLIAPTAGDVLVDGRDITHLPVHRRGLGMVFQSYALFPHMTVAENVGFGLRMRGMATAEAQKHIAEALALLQMQGLEQRYPGQLSGGQQQRVALARSLVTRPKVLLLDEPFGALDAQLRDAMQIELRRMQRRLGVTTVFVTHDQHEAFTMSDRVAVMSGGELQQLDTPSAIYNRPKTPFVAEFIGQVNRFEGTMRGCEGRASVVLVDGRDEPILAETGADQISSGHRVQIMVRPERIVIASPGSSPGRNAQSGIVSDIVFSGEKVSIFIDTAIGPLEVHQFSASTENGTRIAIGEPLVATWDPSDTMVFAAK